MNISDFKSFLESLVRLSGTNEGFFSPNIDTDDKELKENSAFYDEKEEVVIGDFFSGLDTDGNGQLNDTEIQTLSRRLSSVEMFNNVDLSELLDTESESVDKSDADNQKLNTDLTTNKVTTNQLATNKDKKEITEEDLNDIIFNDTNITEELKDKKKQNFESLKTVEDRIKELSENMGNLTSEELKELSSLTTQKEQLLSDRDDIESQIKEICSDETKAAFENIEKQRQIKAAEESGEDVSELEDPDKTDTDEVDNASYAGGGGYTPYSPDSSSEENVKEKTLEELKADLETANGELSTQKDELAAILDGSDATISQLKTDMDTAYEAYQKILEEVSPELAQELDTAKKSRDDLLTNIDNKEKEVNDCEITVTGCERDVESVTSAYNTMTELISELDGAISSETDETKKADLQAKRDSAKQALDALEAAKEEAETALDEANEKLNTANTELNDLKSKLPDADNAVNEVETKIAALDNEELTAAKTDYDTKKSLYESTKDTMISNAKANIDKTEEKIAEIEKSITEKSNESLRSQFSPNTLPGNFVLNGEKYESLLDQDELQALSDKVKKNGALNCYYPDTCLSFAYSYGMWVDGSTKTAISGNASKYPDATSYKEYSGTKEQVLGEIKNQLDNGKAVVLQVNGNKKGTSRHYVTVVGYKSSAGSTLKETDLLIMDVYDGNIESVGYSGNRFMISGKDTGRTYDYQLYIRR